MIINVQYDDFNILQDLQTSKKSQINYVKKTSLIKGRKSSQYLNKYIQRHVFKKKKKHYLVKQSIDTYLFSMSFSTYYKAFRSLIYMLVCKKLNKYESREHDSS